MFNFIALLKRQFLLCFAKRFIFLSIIFTLTMIASVKAIANNVNVLALQAFSSTIYLVCFCFFNTTSFGQDLKSKNKNIKITPTNDYLIYFSYFVYAFLVNAAAKLLFSLISCVLVFYYFGIFYYQAIYSIIVETFLFGFYFANMEMFLMFFLKNVAKYVSIIFIIFNTLSLLAAGMINLAFPSIDFAYIRTAVNPGSFIVEIPTAVFCNIAGIKEQLFDSKGITMLIIFSTVMFFMLFIQILFVFVFGERKSILKE